MTRPILFRVLLPLLVLVLLEALLRAGMWELMATPSSRIGATVALKQRILADSEPIHVVTLGNSRGEYGLDHALLRAMAAKYGKRHVPATLRGAHWMSWLAFSEWLRQERPEVENALFALSVVDLFWVNNGPYEIQMIEPLRGGLVPRAEALALFDWQSGDTYSIFSSLWAYRPDLSDYVRRPQERTSTLRQPAKDPFQPVTLSARNLCALPIQNIDHCAAHPAATDLTDRSIVAECQRTLPNMAQREDWRHPIEPRLQQVRDDIRALRQQQLTRLPYRRPLLVLMPVLKLWRQDAFPQGYEAWVQEVLQPLVASGRIDLIDATTFFDTESGGECRAFLDLYHQNSAAAETLTRALLPRIESALYAPQVPAS
jgi:hypothetical protein